MDTPSETLETQVRRRIASDGEFKGWTNYDDHGFESLAGPFWFRQEADGSAQCAFRAEKKHLRDAGVVHGGCLMTFADLCLFVIAGSVVQNAGVTINLSTDFLDVAYEGDLIVGSGEVTRAGGSLVFVRGQLCVSERTILTFSGAIKRLRKMVPSS